MIFPPAGYKKETDKINGRRFVTLILSVFFEWIVF
jgi:hypothetical protein